MILYISTNIEKRCECLHKSLNINIENRILYFSELLTFFLFYKTLTFLHLDLIFENLYVLSPDVWNSILNSYIIYIYNYVKTFQNHKKWQFIYQDCFFILNAKNI